MPEIEVLKWLAQAGFGGVMLYLYWDERKQRQTMQDKHDQDIQRLHDQRVQDLRLIARLPTDLVADYTMPLKPA